MNAPDENGLRPAELFDLNGFEHGHLFDGVGYVWEILPKIGSYLSGKLKSNCKALRARGDVLPSTVVLYGGNAIFDGFQLIGSGESKGNLKVIREGVELEGAAVVYAGASLLNDNIEIGAGTVVEPGAVIKGPTIIGKNSEVRQGAYLRGDCVVGDMCVVGHTTEMKNSVMLDGSKAGHFAYIGDSILGRDVNLGAGTKLANLKIVSSEVTLRVAGRSWCTGLRKFGAILGDGTETGCNSVTNPGTILGKGSLVYPCINVEGGYYPPRTVISTKKDLIRLRTKPVRKGKS